ncbi:MAG: hypothetical protein MUE36_04040 [Acidimicrobiales bacterium]|jgi:uncharacterized membrane protein YcjF (UPF0283 family)|nr:hypothetical protein [Acidimicrobiales bacterium]
MATTTPSSADPASDANRVEQFKSEVAEMKLKTGNATRERVYAAIGLLLMIVGVAGAFSAYVSATNLINALDVQETQVLAVAFASLTLLGLGLFLRYAIANFLRMWLLRQLYEGQANTQRMIDAVREGR